MEGRRDLESPDEELERDFDQSNCFPVLDEGFQYKKTFIKMNKKLSGTVAFRLKTNVTRALLKENSCDERILERHLRVIDRHQDKRLHQQNRLKLNFSFHQGKRRETWNKDDQFSLDRLNFPQLHNGDRKLASASLHHVYRSAENVKRGDDQTVPLQPVSYGEVEPKIVEYKNHTYLTKEPTVHQLNMEQQRRYDKYRGVNLLSRRSVLDERFQRLSTALSEVKRTVSTAKTDRQIPDRARFTRNQTSLSFTSNPLEHRRHLVTRAATSF